MTVRLVRGARWAGLVDSLTEELSAAGTDPFQKLRVVVASRATGRVLGQQVAARLGISAGIEYLSPADLMRELALQAGVARDRSRWRGTPLDLAVAEALSQEQHQLVQRALAADAERPGRRRATALRIARLLRHYLDHSPELVSHWLGGADDLPGGQQIEEALTWQPRLLRAVTSAMELDPLAVLDAQCAAASKNHTPTFVMAVDHLTQPQLQALRALAGGQGLTILQPTGSPGDEWAQEWATSVTDLPGAPADAPLVTVHDSHGEARQVEVLRDELTRAFAADPTLQPRDVAIVCPAPERYATLLDAAFAPADGGHPGRTLRLQPVAQQRANPVLQLLVNMLRLGSSRASASQLVDLLVSQPVAHRWRFTDRRALIELVAGSGIRWGLDQAHRKAFELEGVQQNTWLRGIDRLLIGLAMGTGENTGLGLSGAEAVTASDLTLVGSLCEVLARIRHAVAEAASPATVTQWVARTRATLDSLVGLPYAEQWQELHARGVLARFESDHLGSATVLTPFEFAHLLEASAQPQRARVAAGNGSMQVLPLGELQHVEFRLVAMVGITDDVVPGRGGALPDSVPLGDRTPDLPRRRLSQLLTHARSAERLIIVRQARSQRTNDPSASPVAVSWLLGELDVDLPSDEGVPHPPTASSCANFGAAPSFDPAAFDGAHARQAASVATLGLASRRRLAARSLPVGAPPTQITLTQLERFLSDPARTFLRAAGNVTLHEEPRVTDHIPLQMDGLENWRLVNALTNSWKDGTPLPVVEAYFRQREDLPPHAIGDAAFAGAKREAITLWEGAGSDWSQHPAAHPVNLSLQLPNNHVVRLVDEVRTRGGLALAANPSRRMTGIIRPWLESLALTAMGTATPAKLHHFVKSQFTNWALTTQYWQVDPLPPEQAAAHLAVLASAYTQAQYRLLPVPVGPALTFVQESAAGAFHPAAWSGPVGHWQGKWAGAGPAWPLFYAEGVAELFEDSLLPGDPANGRPDAFTAWAWELYAPLVTGGAE
ncbi:MAG: exodeoxyribonuclease V subunit gamma [Propionibacteriaceae bacterium]|nr:exodeoxyribonuclease V subunit gamma [Propionibacteriaceae bacterium]